MRSEYATQEQLRGMAEAVKNTLKSALSAQAKRIADTEEKRSELCVAAEGLDPRMSSRLSLHEKHFVAFADHCAHMCREEQQLQESLRLIGSRVETSEKETRRQLEQLISDAAARLSSETDSLRYASKSSRSIVVADLLSSRFEAPLSVDLLGFPPVRGYSTSSRGPWLY